MELLAYVRGRVINQTRYTLMPLECEVEKGGEAKLCDAIRPLEDKIAFELTGSAGPSAETHGHCRFAILDDLGADTLSRLVLTWATGSKRDPSDSFSATVEGRESAAIFCTQVGSTEKGITTTFRLAYRT